MREALIYVGDSNMDNLITLLENYEYFFPRLPETGFGLNLLKPISTWGNPRTYLDTLCIIRCKVVKAVKLRLMDSVKN